MAGNNDILFRKVKTSTDQGVIEYYSIDVVDENGVPKKSLNTADPVAAKHFVNNAKKENPNATINGDPNLDPLPSTASPGSSDPALGQSDQPDPNNPDPPAETANPDNAEGSPYKPPDYNPGKTDSGRPPSKGSNTTKATRYITGVRKSRLQDYKSLSEIERGELRTSGVFGNKRLQPMVLRQDTACEKIIRGIDNNAFIILGNDRVNFPHSGYGGKGHTQTDSIDIVAGLGGHSPSEYVEERADIAATDTTAGKKTKRGYVQVSMATNPNFFKDAARIYISQKTDVDKNFGIAELKGKSNEKNARGPYSGKSAVALKADNIRLIGRESLRLVTGTDKSNSQGGPIDGEKVGIELIANNDHTTLQPMVLGDNLAAGLRRVLFHMEKIAHTFHAYVKYQQKFNHAIANHDHISPFFAIPTLMNLDVFMKGLMLDIDTASKTETDMLKHATNIAGVKSKYFYESGTKWIGSTNNKTN